MNQFIETIPVSELPIIKVASLSSLRSPGGNQRKGEKRSLHGGWRRQQNNSEAKQHMRGWLWWVSVRPPSLLLQFADSNPPFYPCAVWDSTKKTEHVNFTTQNANLRRSKQSVNVETNGEMRALVNVIPSCGAGAFGLGSSYECPERRKGPLPNIKGDPRRPLRTIFRSNPELHKTAPLERKFHR